MAIQEEATRVDGAKADNQRRVLPCLLPRPHRSYHVLPRRVSIKL